MKLVNDNQASLVQVVLSTSFRRNVTLLLAVLVIYNLALGGAGYYLYGKLPEAWKERVTDILKAPGNYMSGKTASPDRFYIDIKQKHLNQLNYVREMSLQKASLHNTEENSVPAIIWHNDVAGRVRLSLKGRLTDHWADPDMMSLKIKARDEQTFFGMRTFSIQHPKARHYMYEWMLHKLFADAGIVHLRYDFISVDINGKGPRIYALEESFDKRLIESNRRRQGPIMKFNRDFYWEDGFSGQKELAVTYDFWGSDIVAEAKKEVFSDPGQTKVFSLAKSLMESFRRNELEVSDVFEAEKLATFFALLDLFGSHHAASLDNIRFYFNPVSTKFEPIIHDNEFLESLDENSILGSGKEIGKHIVNRPYEGWWIHTSWYEAVFKDSLFYQAYIRELERVSRPSYLDDFVKRHKQEIDGKWKTLHAGYPFNNQDPLPMLYQNQGHIRNKLKPKHLVEAALREPGQAGQLCLEITNLQDLPVEVLGVEADGGVLFRPAGQTPLLQAKTPWTPVSVETVCFELPAGKKGADLPADGWKLRARILGSGNQTLDPVISKAPATWELLKGQFGGLASTVAQFDFLERDEARKIISCRPGTHYLNATLVIPAGYVFRLEEGTNLQFTGGAGIISYSPLQFAGSEDRPIVISSSATGSGGVVVLQTGKSSSLRHVQFRGLSAPEKPGGRAEAAVSFYQSPVDMDHCYFADNKGGAQHLSISGGEFQISNSTFFRSRGDAFQGNRCSGTFRNSRFIQSGRDAIRLNGGSLELDEVFVQKAGRKGLNADAKSAVRGSRLTVQQAQTAISSTDLSKIVVGEAQIRDCQVAYEAFQKAPGYGPAAITVKFSSVLGGSIGLPYLIEDGSLMRLAGKAIMPDRGAGFRKALSAAKSGL